MGIDLGAPALINHAGEKSANVKDGVAVRDIKKGEELFNNYAAFEVSHDEVATLYIYYPL